MPYRAGDLARNRLPASFHATLAAELLGGEQILWADVPVIEALRAHALRKLPFAIGYNLFFVVLIGVASGAGGVFGLLLAPFFIVGFALLAAPIEAYRRAGETFYALTDRRALVFCGDEVCSAAMSSSRLRVESTRHADGSGDVLFVWRDAARTRAEMGFLAVHDVGAVEGLLSSAEARAATSPA